MAGRAPGEAGAAFLHAVPRSNLIDPCSSLDCAFGLAAVADAEPPTAAVLPVRAFYRQAVTAWEEGVASLNSGLLRAADNPQDNTVIDEVVAGLALLRAGDTLWARLLEDMERDDMPSPMTPPLEAVGTNCLAVFTGKFANELMPVSLSSFSASG